MQNNNFKREDGQGAAIALMVVALLIAGIIYFVAVDENNDITRSINREEIQTNDPERSLDFLNDDAEDVEEDIGILNMSSLNIEDQKPGNAVMVESAYLENPAYIVIYTSDMDSNPEEMLGQSTLLTSGEKGEINIPLNRNVIDGEELVAVLYQDDGDGVLNTELDQMVSDDGGEVQTRFMINADGDVSTEVFM